MFISGNHIKCVWIWLVCFILGFLSYERAQGIKCWVCHGKSSLRDCHAQYGQMQECPNDDDVCQNDYRTVKGKPLIIKGCKQAEACETELKQNERENQCGRIRLKRDLVCRCCCNFNGCNSKASGCLPPPAPCKKIKGILNGQVYCPAEIVFGSRCQFSCNRKYRLIGSNRAMCSRISKASKKGKWTPEELPFCEKIIVRCNPPRKAPTNGKVVCENIQEYRKNEEFNYEESKCTYMCDKNHYLVGKKVTQCQSSGKWNNDEPTCVIGVCDMPPPDSNRNETCSNGHKFGSTCNFFCKEGYAMIGSAESTCAHIAEREGQWTNKFPRCAQVMCYPEHINPLHGTVECTDENFRGSICTFTCNEGYDMDNTKSITSTSTCEDDDGKDAIGKWRGKPPKCNRIECLPAFKNPENGQVVCTDRNNFGSVCTFTCNIGYDMDRTRQSESTSECRGDEDGSSVGHWSKEAATCKAISCQPAPTNPYRGMVSCTNTNLEGSICTYTCQDDYDLDGTTDRTIATSCNPPEEGLSAGTWSRKPPTCTSITCEPITSITNGGRICTTFSYMRGTTCVFYCLSGYDLMGPTYMSCQDLKRDGDNVGEWTSPTPVCKLGSCTKPDYDESTVIEKCEEADEYPPKSYKVGTSCTYTCISDEYYMVPTIGEAVVHAGVTKTDCTVDKRWTKQPPRCLVKTCLPPMKVIANGHTPKCTDGNNINSQCIFECINKYGLTHDRPLVCQNDGDNDQHGKWSEESPKCERDECDEFGTIVNGKLTCSNGVKIGSVCDVQCIDRYIPKKYKQTVCMPNALWNRRKYVCCVRCLFNRNVNILTMFDSASFETTKEWHNIVDFVKMAIGNMVNVGFNIKIGALRYAEEVDESTMIPFRPLPSRDSLNDFTSEIMGMPLTGKVSNTGNALENANALFFKTLERGRENFVILVSSGASSDNAVESAAALKSRGINILVVALSVNESALKKFVDITGRDRNVLNAATSESLRSISEKINDISMATGCTSASRSQPCS